MKTLDKKTEYDLVNKVIKDRDSKAFSELYRTNIDYVYRFVYSRTGDTHLTEDIVSETFETLIIVIKSFNFKSKFSSFIIGIAINKIREYKRRSFKLNETEFDEEYILDEETQSKENPKLSITIKRAIQKLEDKYRLVLEQRFMKGKSLKDTALFLNISVNNVKVRQNRALKMATKLVNEFLKNEQS